MMVPMQSDYHRRFHEQARQYLDPSVFHDIHVKARGSTGGAAPRTPKGQERQPDTETEPPAPDEAEKEPVHKSALDAISGMWSRTLDALTGRQNVNKSGIEDGLSAFYGAGTQRPPLKNTQAKKKKRVTKSALMTLADAVAEHDGLEPDGIVAIQLGAEHGRTLGAIGLGYIAQDKATIAYDFGAGRLPFEDASVNQVYVRKSAVDDGLDLDAMMPELRRVCAPGARIYSDFGLTTVNKSGDWDEGKHPRGDGGQFGAGSEKTASGKDIPRADSKAYKTKKRLSNAAFVKVSQEKHPSFTKQDHADAADHHEKQQAALTHAANNHIAAHPHDMAGFGALVSAARDHEHAKYVHLAAQKSEVLKSGEWDEDAHPRSDNGEFGSGGKAAANSSASHARNRTAQKLAEHSVERMKALKKRINKSGSCGDALQVIKQTKKHTPKKPEVPLEAKLGQFTQERKQLVQKSVTAEKPIAGLDTHRQIVYAPVLVPDEISVKGHHITCEDIEYSAHRYLREGAICGSEHGRPIDAHVVESFIAPQDLHFTGDGTPYGEQSIPKGSWVVGMKINDPDEWAKVMSGEYTGFSTGGQGILRGWEYS